MDMDKTRTGWLKRLLEHHKLKIDGSRLTTGTEKAGFRVLDIGVGADYMVLRNVYETLNNAGLDARINLCTNREHPDAGKPYIELQSFWWEED